MTPELVDLLCANATVWVPTLVIGEAVRNMGSPQVNGWLDRLPAMVRLAAGSGVTVLAGTDAGMVPHGLIADEVRLLLAAGVPADVALARRGPPATIWGAPASWRVRPPISCCTPRTRAPVQRCSPVRC